VENGSISSSLLYNIFAAKVGWLSKNHPKNLIHKVLYFQATRIDVSPWRINLGDETDLELVKVGYTEAENVMGIK